MPALDNWNRKGVSLWCGVVVAAVVPVIIAAYSPQLQWREPIYIFAGFAGIVAMVLLLAQPLLAMGSLPGLSGLRGRRVHRWVGGVLLFAVIGHVLGLWLTSPPDVVDALLFRSPTPFSAWGVVAMWTVFATAGLAVTRRHLGLRPRTWVAVHAVFATVIVVCTVVHANLIDGTMGAVSKAGLSVGVVAAFIWMLVHIRARYA